MYSLRIIEETRKDEKSPFGSIPTTYNIGEFYSVLKKGSTGKFEEKFKEYPEWDIKSVRGIVIGSNKMELFLMEDLPNEKTTYYIMTDSGSTLERL